MKIAIEIMQSMNAVAPWHMLIQISCCLYDFTPDDLAMGR
jgi:hypothetical protein